MAMDVEQTRLQELVAKYTGPIKKLPPNEPKVRKPRAPPLQGDWSGREDNLYLDLGTVNFRVSKVDDAPIQKPLVTETAARKLICGHDNEAEIAEILNAGDKILNARDVSGNGAGQDDLAFEEKRRREAERLRLSDVDGYDDDTEMTGIVVRRYPIDEYGNPQLLYEPAMPRRLAIVESAALEPDTGGYSAAKAPSATPVVVNKKRKLTSADIAALRAKEQQLDQDRRLAEITTEVETALAAGGRKPNIGTQLKEARAILKPSGGFYKWQVGLGLNSETARRLMKDAE
jgi:hypothetical protein